MDLEQRLAHVLGSTAVLTDPELTVTHERDWTGRFGAPARAVVKPRTTVEVAKVVRCCAEAGVPVVPQGGNTGLAGGSVPRTGEEIVLCTTRMTDLGTPDPAVGDIVAQAGVTLGALQAAAAAHGLDATLDFAARDSCTVGGVVACDAGGARALRHGTARAHVAGLEAVLGDGTVVDRMSGLTKDNAGFDLPGVLIGSEGTLAVITRVRWRLEPRQPARTAALIPLADATAARELLRALRTHAPSLDACEFFVQAGLELVLAHQRRTAPLEPAGFYVLAECAAQHDPVEELAAALEAAGIEDALIADDTASRERLWSLREGHTEAINAAGIPHKLDVGVPLDQLAEFLDRLPRAVGSDASVIPFGHLGDGNVHVNVLGADPEDHALDDRVLGLVLELGGTISAEHGVGTVKAGWLERQRGASEVAAMRRMKLALDPAGILNPGVVLPAASRSSRPLAPGR